jgi:superoxide dismutase, Cu-Zn family
MNTGRHEMRQGRRWTLAAAGAALLGGLTAVTAAVPAQGHGWEARTILRDASGARVGTVKFDGNARGTVVKVVVHGVTVGLDEFHGLHIHANDAKAACDPTAPAFTNVGGHWNPTGVTHSHHHGDLPSLLILTDGTGTARFATGRFEPDHLDGKAVILHAGVDNFGNIPDRYSTGVPPIAGPDATTKATGDSGGRIACGIIDVD